MLARIARGVAAAMLLAAALPAAATTKVLALGDSLTEGYNLSKDVAWPALVEAALRAKGHDVTVVNAGVSGATTASGVSRLRWALNGKDRPEIMVLALGANDGLRGLKLDEAKKNLVDTIRLAKQNGLTVLLAGMRIPPNYGKAYTEEFHAMYVAIAKEEDVPLIPFLLEGVGGEAAMNLPDGIHPNEKGYQVVAKTVLEHLEPLVRKAAKTKPTAKKEP